MKVKHLLRNGSPKVRKGDRVTAYTPDGYIVGKVYDSSQDKIHVELDDELGRLVTIKYISFSRPYGPHWKLRPAWGDYKIRSREDWERIDSIFPPRWQREVCYDNFPFPVCPNCRAGYRPDWEVGNHYHCRECYHTSDKINLGRFPALKV